MLPVTALTRLNPMTWEEATQTIDLLLCAVLAIGVVSLMVLAV
jgi:hypothetical protein